MKYYAGIDLGGTFIKCGIVDESGNILFKDKIPTGRERSYTEIAADMANLALEAARRAGVESTAVGIGSPGTVDSENGVIVYSNNIRWDNVPLGKTLQNILHKPVFVTNDANAAALGESVCGAGKDYRSLILITLGTGIGGGIVLDGTLYEGFRSAGAEVGHQVIRLGGAKCTCGRRGCFEAYASATALIRQTQRAMGRHPKSRMWEICKDLSQVDGRTVFQAVRLGDDAAKSVLQKYIEYLATGITNLANSFRPEIILLGGGICEEQEMLIQPLTAILQKEQFGGSGYAPVKLGVAKLKNDAGVLGAAEFAKRACADR